MSFIKSLQEKTVDRDLLFLLSSMFFRRIVMGFLEIVRGIYFALIGFDPLVIGLIIGAGSIVGTLRSALFGVLSDKYGRKIFLIIGSFTSILRMLLFATSRDFWILLLAQIVGALGEGAGAGQPVVSGYIAEKLSGSTKRTQIFSLTAITNALASTLGSLAAALPAYFKSALNLNEVDSYLPLFWAGATLNLMSLLLILPLKEGVSKRHKVKREKTIFNRSSLKEIGVYSIIRSTDGLAMGLVSSLAPLYFYLRFNMSSESLAPIYAVTRAMPIPIYFITPLLVNRFGYVNCLVVSRISSGSFALCFAFSNSIESSIIAFIFYRVLILVSMPVRQSFATEIIDTSRMGSLVGISSSIRSFLRSSAPIISGYLFQISQMYLPMVMGSLLLMLNAIQFRIFYSRRTK